MLVDGDDDEEDVAEEDELCVAPEEVDTFVLLAEFFSFADGLTASISSTVCGTDSSNSLSPSSSDLCCTVSSLELVRLGGLVL